MIAIANRCIVLLFLLAIAGCLAGSLAGCGRAADGRIAVERQRLVLPEEPGGATSIAEARKNLIVQPEVTLVGRIGAADHEAFEPDRATFVLSDLPADGHHQHAGHDADNCPFCRHRAKQMSLALVQLVDERGEILRTDAPTLLGVEAGQLVVVRGRGQWNDKLELLVVKAAGVHIRK
ncbi:MAG TPA: hypothetical protein VMF30_06805 [Pirellulales bacterium]|nr:hypothetical protein [Pirellulales bacterium]